MAHAQSKPKCRKTTQTGPRSSPQPIRTTPHSSAAKPAPNDPPRSRVLGHMTPYATLTGPYLSPTSIHAAPESTVTKPTTNPLPNTDNDSHQEDTPRPAENAADVEIIALCDSDDSEVQAFEAFKALRCSKQFPCTIVRLCDNLLTQTEYAPGRCSANEHCQNQTISKKLFPPTTVVADSKLTHALRVDEGVPPGTKIIEYVGEHIGKEENWYIARVGTNGDLYVDASKFDTKPRLMVVVNTALEHGTILTLSYMNAA
ncbi:hypothetical protein H257_18231 [Aphanomyces astaci]|uniref:Uncharacterized protein n=1 Tax=Aphanomyces astaci TaxID=112090 RepID=W4FBV1_APHAT|nr:hypothetical protein H257_18231 [Aphanomyces astaci]ETV64962.1 hypothetical protein H257_18231 [Aphanomyces astaci]|eukprot:XP_009845552.1 hypothetical protein H257_18231 [Aphanomyces astaci]